MPSFQVINKLFVYKLIWRTLLSTFAQKKKKKNPSEFLVEQRAKSNEQQATSKK